jgi:hypothetical protein
MRRAARLAIFAALVAAGTVVGGWWTVPVIAAVWARLLPSERRVRRTAALGAALGWAALLAWSARHEPILTVATRMSEVLDLPAWGFTAATLLFPALLAACAADLVAADRR